MGGMVMQLNEADKKTAKLAAIDLAVKDAVGKAKVSIATLREVLEMTEARQPSITVQEIHVDSSAPRPRPLHVAFAARGMTMDAGAEMAPSSVEGGEQAVQASVQVKLVWD